MIECLSGPFANTGEAVFRNLVWATERVNARRGIALPGGKRPLALERFDSKGQTEEALSALRTAIDSGIQVVLTGNWGNDLTLLVVAVMGKAGQPGVRLDVEGSGHGFKPLRTVSAAQSVQGTTCQMMRF